MPRTKSSLKEVARRRSESCRRWRVKNRERIKEYKRKRYADLMENNPDKIKKNARSQYLKHREKRKRWGAEYYLKIKSDPVRWARMMKRVRDRDRVFHKRYPERSRERSRKHSKKPEAKKKAREWRMKAYRLNPGFKLSLTIRSRIANVLRNCHAGLRKASKTIELLGCSFQDLRVHLESLFQPGMSWKNYGLHGWHVDHRRPCASFDLTDPEQQRQCFNFKNLQPLWAKDNWSKHAKWTPNLLAT